MDVRQLEYVVAVAEEGSFTGAARRCHVAQSALSHQVARLEAEVGSKLFERTSRSVRISEAGRALLPHAVQVLSDMANARAALDGLAETIRGRLRIGMTQTASQALGAIALIGEVHRRYPESVLSTASGPGSELIQAIQDGYLDVALAAQVDPGPQSEITFTPLIDEPLVAVVPTNHPLARRRRVRLSELSGGFVEFRSGTTLRALVDRAFVGAGIERVSNFEVGQISEMVQYASNGLGTAIVPQSFTRPGPTGGPAPRSMGLLQLVDPVLQLSLGAYRRRGHSPPITNAFLALVAQGVDPRPA